MEQCKTTRACSRMDANGIEQRSSHASKSGDNIQQRWIDNRTWSGRCAPCTRGRVLVVTLTTPPSSWRALKRWIGSTATANIHETFKKRSYSPQLQHFLIIRQFGGNSFIWKINAGKRALDVTNNFETEIFRGNINRSEEEDSSNHTGFHRWKPYKCDFTVHRQYVYRGI